MIRAEAETCFETKYENKYFDATLAFDDWKFRAHKGPNNQKHNDESDLHSYQNAVLPYLMM